MTKIPKENFIPWHTAEEKIAEEIAWLHRSIQTFSQGDEEKGAPVKCRECLVRKIAVLIVSGRVLASEIAKKPPLNSFWMDKSECSNRHSPLPPIHHGGKWHRETMERIEHDFLCSGYEVVREPTLHWGRADLGVYKKGMPDCYIEVGTTSFFKLWLNLQMMENFIYLIVPNDDILIEFAKLTQSQSKHQAAPPLRKTKVGHAPA